MIGQPSLVAFSGSRDLWVGKGSRARALLEMEIERLPVPSTVIHGASGNVDELAGELALARGLAVDRYPADWEKYGKRAGPIRNSELAKMRPGRWVIVWDGHSSGSLDALNKANRVPNCEVVEHVVRSFRVTITVTVDFEARELDRFCAAADFRNVTCRSNAREGAVEGCKGIVLHALGDFERVPDQIEFLVMNR